VSETRSAKETSPPHSSTSVASITRFESGMVLALSASPGGESSSPVEMRATRGRGTTLSSPVADCAGGRKCSGGQEGTARQHPGAGRHGLPLMPHVGARRDCLVDADRSRGRSRAEVLIGQLDRHDSVGTGGKWGSGHDSDRRTRLEDGAGPASGRAVADHRELDDVVELRRLDIGRPHCVAVHRRVRERWHGDACREVRAQGQPSARPEGKGDRGERGDEREQLPAVLVHSPGMARGVHCPAFLGWWRRADPALQGATSSVRIIDDSTIFSRSLV
jgi:hypothetical protein